LRSVDFLAVSGRGYKQRPWLTDNFFGVLGQFKELREVRAIDQNLLDEHCFWHLRKHPARLQVLHLSGCKQMGGDVAFGFLHLCVNLESLRLPKLVVGQSAKKLGTGTNRWCQGLCCPRLRELSVDAWPSLEDSGVQMLVSNCGALRVVCLRAAPKLSDDAVTYLVALPMLVELSISFGAGLTDAALRELASASHLRSLDLSGCRQLGEQGVVALAESASMASAGCGAGPRLQSVRFDQCPNLGREAAGALASKAAVLRCSLSCCRPLPEAATFWDGAGMRADACLALGMPTPLASRSPDEAPLSSASDGQWARQAFADGAASIEAAVEEDEEEAELPQCAICLDDIERGEPAWKCPVCRNSLHDTEDCGRGWLRLKQCCPTCRSATWAPPPEEPAPAALARQVRPTRANSADVHSGRLRPSRLTPPAALSRSQHSRNHLFEAQAVISGIGSSLGLGITGAHVQLAPASPARLEVAPSLDGGARGRRPPRPGVVPTAVTASAASSISASARLAAANPRLAAAIAVAAAGGAPPAPVCSAPSRSSSLPPSGRGRGFSLVGLSIVGAARA